MHNMTPWQRICHSILISHFSILCVEWQKNKWNLESVRKIKHKKYSWKYENRFNSILNTLEGHGPPQFSIRTSFGWLHYQLGFHGISFLFGGPWPLLLTCQKWSLFTWVYLPHSFSSTGCTQFTSKMCQNEHKKLNNLLGLSDF
jgi:hypothetical protein